MMHEFTGFRHSILLMLASASVLLAACGSATAAPDTAVPTLDPCAPENIRASTGEVNDLIRQFDDKAAVASSVLRSQLPEHVSELQEIRRAAQDQAVPVCLARLKELQLEYMSTMINTLLAFLSASDQELVVQGIGAARQLHNQYVLELAGLQGVTATVATRPGPSAPTPAAEVPPPAVAGNVAYNPGPSPINLHAAPAEDAQVLGILDIGASAVALARSGDGQWVQVEVPGKSGQLAWIRAALVQVSGDLPVASP